MTTTEGREMSGTERKIETVTAAVIIKPVGEWIHDETVTRISLEDEAAGCFVQIAQPGVSEPGTVQIDPCEWEAIKAAVDAMVLDAIAQELAGIKEARR